MFYYVTECVLCLPAGEDLPVQCSPAAGIPGWKQSYKSAVCLLTDLWRECKSRSLHPPLSAFPLLGQCTFFANGDPFPSFIPQPEGPHGQFLKKKEISSQRTLQTTCEYPSPASRIDVAGGCQQAAACCGSCLWSVQGAESWRVQPLQTSFF